MVTGLLTKCKESAFQILMTILSTTSSVSHVEYFSSDGFCWTDSIGSSLRASLQMFIRTVLKPTLTEVAFNEAIAELCNEKLHNEICFVLRSFIVPKNDATSDECYDQAADIKRVIKRVSYITYHELLLTSCWEH